MHSFRSDYLATLQARGFLDNCTDPEGLDAAMRERTVSAYIGFDCTAPSLHVGSLLQILALRWLQQTGHRPIVLMGGGTTRIGDPSGRDEARKLLDAGAIASNMAGIRKVFDAMLRFGDGPQDAVMADNIDWLRDLRLIAFLRDTGRHFSINRMLSFESVRSRLERESPLSLLEFSYMVLQAYDFVELAQRYDCTLQLGGSDQWGNIVNGIDLGRRVRGLQLYGVTTPLLTTSAGTKMGKTAQGAVWLNAELCSAYDFWQFWRNTDDADVGRFLRLFTELPLDEVDRLAELEGKEQNEAKIVLADQVTTLVHGAEAARRSAATAQSVFQEGGHGETLPALELARDEIGAGLPLARAFVRAGLTASSGEAKRLIRDGGARMDGDRVTDPGRLLTVDQLESGELLLSAGRKRHAVVRLIS